MASLQRDLADQLPASGDCPAGASVKLNRRSLGGVAFDIQFDDEAKASAGSDTATGRQQQQQQQQQLSSEEIAERLAAAEQRREQQLAERVSKLESKLTHVSEVSERLKRQAEQLAEQHLKSVEETMKAAEERRMGRMEAVKQRARGQSAGGGGNGGGRKEAMREQQEAARQQLEADIRAKEERRREQLERIVQGAQQHLAKVGEVRAQRHSSGPPQQQGE